MKKVVGKLTVFFCTFIFVLCGQNYKASAQSPVEDLRLELTLLSSQVEDVREALLSPDVRSLPSTDTGIALLRLDALEAKLRSAVGRLEALEYHLQILEQDAKNRIGNFNARLIELESKNSSSTILNTSKRNLEIKEVQAEISGEEVVGEDTGGSLEIAALAKALGNYNAGEYRQAIEKFLLFKQFYPESVNRRKASFFLASSYFALNQFDEAAKEFLEVFSFDPSGEFAFESLLSLANSLQNLGEFEQSCLTLEELRSRFPEKLEDNSDLIFQVENKIQCER